ncbi:hypothetical protein JYK22_21700, partial [Nonomuraea sp. RK-328]|nr:hypothetical protein [Nonomuraea sp. RK-328]
VTLVSVIPSAQQILIGAIGELKVRGRAYGDWEYGQCLCVLAAMAVAAGRTADYWDEVRQAEPHEYEPVDETLLIAARSLAKVVRPAVAVEELSVDGLIDLISDWHDGPNTKDGYTSAPPNWKVFDALIRAAASSAGQAGAA